MSDLAPEVGDVWRQINATEKRAFEDAVITRVNLESVDLSRPYAYASLNFKSTYLGFERIDEVSYASLRTNWLFISKGRVLI